MYTNYIPYIYQLYTIVVLRAHLIVKKLRGYVTHQTTTTQLTTTGESQDVNPGTHAQMPEHPLLSFNR